MSELEDAKKKADKRGNYNTVTNSSIGPLEHAHQDNTVWIATELRALRLTIEALAISVEKIANPSYKVYYDEVDLGQDEDGIIRDTIEGNTCLHEWEGKSDDSYSCWQSCTKCGRTK